MKKLFAMLMSISLVASLIPSAMAATDINDGLVGHWTFDDATTALYSEVNKDLWGLATPSSSGVARNTSTKKVGTASYKLTRANKPGITLGKAPAIMDTGAMTVSFWANSTRSQGLETTQMIFRIGDNAQFQIMMNGSGADNGGGGIYARGRDASNTVVGLHSNGNDSTTQGTPSSPSATTNQWYHMVVTLTYDENGKLCAEGYQDGVHTGGRYATKMLLKKGSLANLPVYVSYPSTTGALDGYVDELRVYNRVLSEDEIKELYSLDYTAVHRNPTAQWTFDTNNQDTVGKYEWNETAGAKATTNPIGFANKGLKVSEDTTAGEANTFDVTLPAKMTSFTINTWVKRNERTGSEQRIFQAIDTENTNGIFTTYLHDGMIKTKLVAKSLSDSAWSSGTGGQSNTEAACDPKLGEWHMITTTFYNGAGTDYGNSKNGYYLRTYYDGKLMMSPYHTNRTDLGDGYASILSAGTTIRIGGGFDNTQNFRGTFDNVAIWNSVLSADDIKKLYDSQKQALPTATDSEITLVNGLALGTDNIAAFTTTGIAESTNTYEAVATVDNTFKNEYIVIENIPTGLYVSEVVTGNDVTTITFAGSLEAAVTSNKTIRVYVMPYGEYNANSNAQAVTVKTGYELESTGSIAADTGVYTATVTNNSYDDTATVDVVVAVYDSNKRMKDVYLSKDITTTVGSAFDVTSDALQYEDGDTVRMFIFESISNINPVNALVK